MNDIRVNSGFVGSELGAGSNRQDLRLENRTFAYFLVKFLNFGS